MPCPDSAPIARFYLAQGNIGACHWRGAGAVPILSEVRFGTGGGRCAGAESFLG